MKIKYLIQDNKFISCFDVVTFLTPDIRYRVDIEFIKSFNDYRIIVTHGVVGELLQFMDNDAFGLDISKICILYNNIEVMNHGQQRGYRGFLLSEYIFLDDSRYYYDPDIDKTSLCVFPGRAVKLTGLDLTGCDIEHHQETPSNEMTNLYNKFKCGLMVSEMEGSCRAVGEMLMCGLPVISVGINNDHGRVYYPENKDLAYLTYSIVLPNTLGGRELWLNPSNSLISNRDPISIKEALTRIDGFDYAQIRYDFIKQLFNERLRFMYILKAVLDELGFKIWDILIDDIINLPYSLTTFTNTMWGDVKSAFLNSYSKL